MLLQLLIVYFNHYSAGPAEGYTSNIDSLISEWTTLGEGQVGPVPPRHKPEVTHY
jgi:hypothetical protein